MANSTVENLDDIATASPAGLQAGDLFYIFRPGTPDADFRGDGADVLSYVMANIPNDMVTYAKIQNVSATDKILGRSTAGAGDIEEITCTAFARTILDDTSASAVRTTIGAGTGNGDVTGAASSTDNTLPRFDGTGGKTIQTSGVAVSDNDEISGFKTLLNDQTGTTYTVVAGDTGKTVTCSNASAITVTLPNSLAVGFTCEVIQKGAGQVTFSAASGATINNRSTHTKIAGQYGAVRLTVVANSGGAAAVYNLAGDTGA